MSVNIADYSSVGAVNDHWNTLKRQCQTAYFWS